jgi:hypothetical protein
LGSLGIRPPAGSGWAEESRPDRLPATYRRTHGITYFHGCYSVGDDQMRGVNRRRKGIDHTWSALRTIRAARPDGAPPYVILDNLSAHTNWPSGQATRPAGASMGGRFPVEEEVSSNLFVPGAS